jgi:hypothetical protein
MPLRTLLDREYSFDTALEILKETAALYREPIQFRWYYLLLNRIFGSLIDNPELSDADQADPILKFIYQQARHGLDAIDARNLTALLATANALTEAYSAIP